LARSKDFQKKNQDLASEKFTTRRHRRGFDWLQGTHWQNSSDRDCNQNGTGMNRGAIRNGTCIALMGT
jgi:hypothetical protein